MVAICEGVVEDRLNVGEPKSRNTVPSTSSRKPSLSETTTVVAASPAAAGASTRVPGIAFARGMPRKKIAAAPPMISPTRSIKKYLIFVLSDWLAARARLPAMQQALEKRQSLRPPNSYY